MLKKLIENKRNIYGCRIILALLLSSTIMASESSITIERWQSKSGTEVAFNKVANKIVAIKLILDAGSARDGANFGIANVTNAMLETGSDDMSSNDVARNFAAAGAIYSSYTGKDSATISLKMPHEEQLMNKSLANLTSIIGKRDFIEEELTRIRRQVTQGIKIIAQDPKKVAFSSLFKILYEPDIYGHDTNGTVESVTQITKEMVAQFHQQYYRAKNAKLAIVGDLTLEQAQEISEKISNALMPGDAAPKLSAAITKEPTDLKVAFPSSQTTFLLATSGITANNSDSYPLSLARYILGGGMDSLLFDSVREKQGLVYYISSYFIPMKLTGPFIISSQTSAKNYDKAKDSALETLAKFIKNGPNEQQLVKAKNVIVANFYEKLTNNESIAANLVWQMFYDIEDNYFSTFKERIESLSTDDLRIAMQKYVKIDNFSTVAVGPKNDS